MNELPFWNTKTKAVAFVSSLSPIRLEVETDLFDENDKLLFAAKTEMGAIDFVERKIRKISTLEFPKDMEVAPSNINEPFSKMKTEFESSDLIYSQKIYASDTDFTNHTNNVRYVKFLMNTFDSTFYDKKSITDFDIQFIKESKEGDILNVFKKEGGDHEFIFSIKNGEEAVAMAVMVYNDASREWKK